jgi:hypothetical protein
MSARVVLSLDLVLTVSMYQPAADRKSSNSCRSLLGAMIYVGGCYVVTATGQFAYRPLPIAALVLLRTSSLPALNFGTGQQESEDCRQHQRTTGANSDVATGNQRQAVV